MKIANIVTNAVLGAAVIVLFILHFTDGRSSAENGGQAASSEMAEMGDISIAFFSMDSVMANWDLYFKYQQELEKKQTEKETEFSGKTESFYQRVQDAQYKIQRGLVTRSEAEQLQQQLASEEQSLAALQNQYAAELQEEGMVKNRQMLDMIEKYVAELSQANGFSYVYSYQFGGNLIYGAAPYNITSQVVAGLNEKYKPGTEIE
jgi:outer membrane protein